MNTNSRTAVFLCVAGASLLLAVAVHYAGRPSTSEGFSEVGQEFFPEFLDPLKASELSVTRYDSENREPQAFSVRRNDSGLWTIPSHHDYPAEAEERLARTAASMIGIRKVALQSRSKDDWGRYGVADPADEAVTAAPAEDGEDTADPRGTRLTLKDSSGNPLVDLIVGTAVADRPQHFFVRQPDKNPVYIAKLNVDLSTRFSDWIEPDLLKLNQPDINRVLINRYSIDEQKGELVPGEVLDFNKDRTAGKWSLDGINPESEQVREAAVTDLVRNLDQLKIVGVRPKPEGLNADLTVSEEVAGNPLLRQVLQQDMARQGFFIARGPQNSVQLVSNEGELIAGTTNGVRYTLYFGEIARGSAKDIETGLGEKAPETADAAEADAKSDPAAEAQPAAPPETPGDDAEKGPRRYLLVKVDYDEALLGPKPTEPVAPEKPAILNDGAAPAAPAGEAKPDSGDKPAETPAGEAKPADEKSESPKESGSDQPAPNQGSCDEPTPPPATEAGPADEKPTEPAPAPPADAAPATPATPPTPAADETKPATADETAKPAAPAAQTPPTTPPDPKVEAQRQYDQAMGEYEAAKAAFPATLKAWEDRAKEGQKRVQELSTRFSGWYYVITAESFEKFQLNRAGVVEPKTAAPAPGAETPGLPGIPGLPPGLPGLPGN
ncbi:MAG: hypothetical protein RLZZ436_2655 [Planctomycetota bacterium]|jgi:hypothetical protein